MIIGAIKWFKRLVHRSTLRKGTVHIPQILKSYSFNIGDVTFLIFKRTRFCHARNSIRRAPSDLKPKMDCCAISPLLVETSTDLNLVNWGLLS
ncbi:hypothetical protein GX51_03777 [Blastomyces parvus]|uniref:Uncharacterized protein n=1 Tax=Blastomyces parvus TaxID=2060905 RepID=A0A2B7X587_9EURO|nr:hypothetical protein GX51_03777 [Blastomyces parvus]